MTTTVNDVDSALSRLQAQAAVRRQPYQGTFELTNRCNLTCRMCYVCHPASNRKLYNQELPATSWHEIARQAVEEGMVFLLLTGGEVFLRKDFFDIYEPLTRMGIVISLYTNGTLVDDGIAERLAKSPPSITEITLYGATVDTYDNVTGVHGSYKRCCAGIENLLAQEIPVGLKSTITKQNIHELDAMKQMAENWGVSFSAAWLLTKRRDGQISDVNNCRLSVPDCIALESSSKASAFEEAETILRENSIENKDANFYCHAGKATFVVNPYGKMNACLDLEIPSARPLDDGFSTAWKQVQYFVDSAPPISPICLACKVRDYCPRCPAWSLLETNTLTDPVPYLCDIAHARKSLHVNSK